MCLSYSGWFSAKAQLDLYTGVHTGILNCLPETEIQLSWNCMQLGQLYNDSG